MSVGVSVCVCVCVSVPTTYLLSCCSSGCQWVKNNYNTAGEQNIGNFDDPDECIVAVREECPDATIANFQGVPEGEMGSCWCQYGDNMEIDESTGWRACLLSSNTVDGGGAAILHCAIVTSEVLKSFGICVGISCRYMKLRGKG